MAGCSTSDEVLDLRRNHPLPGGMVDTGQEAPASAADFSEHRTQISPSAHAGIAIAIAGAITPCRRANRLDILGASPGNRTPRLSTVAPRTRQLQAVPEAGTGDTQLAEGTSQLDR